MKIFSKKSVSLVLILTLVMALCMPSLVNAGSIGFVGSGGIVTFNETETSNEEAEGDIDMETYINSKKDDFSNALAEQNVTVDLSKANVDPNTLFSTSEPYKYATVTDINSGYSMIDSVLTKTYTVSYTTVTVTLNETASSGSSAATQITGANVSLVAPKVGDSVAKITKDDGYGEYEVQSVQPTVSTTTEGLEVNAFWVMGLQELSEESFFGTFEEDTYYYALIDFEAHDGYELPATFPDGIKINGQAPDEVFAVMGGRWNHCIAKIKATTTGGTGIQAFGHNNIWTVSGGQIAVLYENRDEEQVSLDGKTWVDKGLVVDFVVGDSITIKAKENEGFKFVGWYVSDVEKGADYYDRTKLVSTEATYTYQPTITTVDGIDEPINYLTAAFEEKTETETDSDYEFIDDTANQSYTINQDEPLTFRINADYSKFENGGKVLIDNEETTEFTSKSGSTVITINKDFANSLSVGKHTIKVDFNDGESATTNFTIAKAENKTEQEDEKEKKETEQEEQEQKQKSVESDSINPQTGDNIAVWITLMGVSMLGVIATIKYTNKRK